MKIGDVYYEKHTVVGISKRTNTVSETDVERVDMLPIDDVLDKIRTEIEQYNRKPSHYPVDMIKIETVLQIIDKHKTKPKDIEMQATEFLAEARACAER